MANICYICKKGTVYGRNIKHKASGRWALKAPRTGKRLLPNLRPIRVENENGAVEKVKVCMKCYKRLREV